MKCDNCLFEVEKLEDVFCEECSGEQVTWCAEICKKCYDSSNDLRIFLQHLEDSHNSVDIV